MPRFFANFVKIRTMIRWVLSIGKNSKIRGLQSIDYRLKMISLSGYLHGCLKSFWCLKIDNVGIQKSLRMITLSLNTDRYSRRTDDSPWQALFSRYPIYVLSQSGDSSCIPQLKWTTFLLAFFSLEIIRLIVMTRTSSFQNVESI